MTKCIYREITLNHNEPEDSDTATLEHIIPWAIGGSNGFATGDASKGANNNLGSKVDAKFADTLPIAIKRFKFQIKSQKGNVPSIVWKAVTPDGDKATFTVNPDWSTEVKIGTVVDRPAPGQAGPMTASGPREQLKPILSGLLKGLKKRNEKVYTRDGRLLESLDDLLSASEPRTVEELMISLKYFDPDAWTRGIMKIALAAGHKILGPDWTFGPAGAKIRQTVMNVREKWPTSMRGNLAGEWDRAIRLPLGKTAQVRDANLHTIAVLPANKNGASVMCISLFGGDGVPEAVIDIGDLPQTMMNELNRQDNRGTILGYRTDPGTRVATPITIGEMERQVATKGPTNKKMMNVLQDRSLR